MQISIELVRAIGLPIQNQKPIAKMLGQAMCKTSLGWLSRLKKEEPTAWELLVDRYSPRIYAQCRHSGINPEDSKDILQQVLISVHRKVCDFSPKRDAGFRRWLSTITRNAILNFFRKNKNRDTAVGGSSANNMISACPDLLSGGSSSIQSPMFSREVGHKLNYVLSTFRSRTQDVFRKVILDGKSIDDVANELQMSRGAVRQAKYMVLKKLREEFRKL